MPPIAVPEIIEDTTDGEIPPGLKKKLSVDLSAAKVISDEPPKGEDAPP